MRGLLMLDNDLQLFFKMLEALTGSLRDLTAKYAVLVENSTRQNNEREKIDDVVIKMERDLSSSFLLMVKEFENLKNSTISSKDRDEKVNTAIASISKTLDEVKEHILSATKAAEISSSVSKEGKDVIVHVDGHMDGFTAQLATLTAASADIKTMMLTIEEMKKQVEPFKKLAMLFSKPVAIIVGIYIIFTTIAAAMGGCQQVKKYTHPAMIRHGSVTNNSTWKNISRSTEEQR